MAQYIVRHTCGHETAHQLYGPTSERQSRAGWYKTQPCAACKQRAAEAAAQRAADDRGLPTLAGTAKQVAWATKIRHQMVGQAERWLAEHEQALQAHPDFATEAGRAEAGHQLSLIDTELSMLTAKASAAWWIDHRNVDGGLWLRDRARERRNK